MNSQIKPQTKSLHNGRSPVGPGSGGVPWIRGNLHAGQTDVSLKGPGMQCVPLEGVVKTPPTIQEIYPNTKVMYSFLGHYPRKTLRLTCAILCIATIVIHFVMDQRQLLTCNYISTKWDNFDSTSEFSDFLYH